MSLVSARSGTSSNLLHMVEITWRSEPSPWAWDWNTVATLLTAVGVLTAIVTAIEARRTAVQEKKDRLDAEDVRRVQENLVVRRSQAVKVAAWVKRADFAIIIENDSRDEIPVHRSAKLTINNSSDLPITTISCEAVAGKPWKITAPESIGPGESFSQKTRMPSPVVLGEAADIRMVRLTFTDAAGREWERSLDVLVERANDAGS